MLTIKQLQEKILYENIEIIVKPFLHKFVIKKLTVDTVHV